MVKQTNELLDRALAHALDIQSGGSRLEVVSSRDGNPFISLNDTQNKAQLACLVSDLPVRKLDLIPFNSDRF